ncbi:MAG: nucleotidyltransferase family protein [Phycisphaerales bacterium]|nr:nucleotidyltransferase family protein [Phycisphaerales bacterium]
MSARIDIPKATIEEFCRRHHIRRLALFGSVLREDFLPESDVDVLVEFDPEARVGLITLAGMEIELSRILGRRADMHTAKGLNPHFRDEALALAEVQYEQA